MALSLAGALIRRTSSFAQQYLSSRIIIPKRSIATNLWQVNNHSLLIKGGKPYCQYFSSTAPQHADTYSDEKVDDPTIPVKASEEENHRAAVELLNLNEKDTRMLKIIKMEVDVMESLGHRVPQHINDAMWHYLLKKCPTYSRRSRILRFWFKGDKIRASDLAKKEARKQKHIERLEKLQELRDEGVIGTHKNTYQLRVSDTTMNRHYMNNLCYSMMNGPHLVFDMGFHEYMTDRELKEMIKQMHIAHGANKVTNDPFHFHMCNVESNGKIEHVFDRNFAGSQHIPFTITDQHYLDIYPKEKLVYLTPNSRNVLKTLHHDDIYIIGGIVDLANEQPLTFAKAKKENIRTAKLPLDNYMKWVQGTKALTLDQMVKILITYRQTDDWRQAFIHVPKRKAIQ